MSLSELAYASEGFDRTGGVERKLLADARGRKAIVSLETVESQYAMMDGLSPEVQVQLLQDTLRRAESSQEE